MNIHEEAKLKTEVARAEKANELLSDEIMVEAFTVLNRRFTEEWANSPVRDSEGRERIWLMQKLLKSVEDHLREIAQTGKLASLQLHQHQTMLQKAKAAMREIF
jgi:preprotein translocase subunit SecD